MTESKLQFGMASLGNCAPRSPGKIAALSTLILVLCVSAIAPANAQFLALFGCVDNDAACDSNTASGVIDAGFTTPLIDLGQGLTLSGTLDSFPNTLPPNIGQVGSGPAGGLRLTSATLSYDKNATAPLTFEVDLASADPGLLPAGPMRVISHFDGNITPDPTLPNLPLWFGARRDLHVRTLVQGFAPVASTVPTPPNDADWTGVVQAASVPFNAATPFAPIPPGVFGGLGTYTPPTNPNVFVILGGTLYPGDVVSFPTSVEVGYVSVPEPSTLALIGSLCCCLLLRRRRS